MDQEKKVTTIILIVISQIICMYIIIIEKKNTKPKILISEIIAWYNKCSHSLLPIQLKSFFLSFILLKCVKCLYFWLTLELSTRICFIKESMIKEKIQNLDAFIFHHHVTFVIVTHFWLVSFMGVFGVWNHINLYALCNCLFHFS